MENKIETGLEEKPEAEPKIAAEGSKEALEKPEEKKSKPKRKISKRKRNLVIVIVVIAAALIIGLWGASPADYPTVSDIINQSDGYLDETVEVKGLVEDWNSSGKRFNLSDGALEITILYTTLPEGFNNGKDVVVKGILEDNNGLVIISQEIQVGCPSRY